MTIVGNMASYPGRSELLPRAVESIVGQVDRLNLCLNEYRSVPDWIERQPSITAVIPERDLKDTGKFLFAPPQASTVFYLDDDILYPEDYVERTLREMRRRGLDGAAVGYHGSWYRNPRPLRSARGLKEWLGWMVGRRNPMWDRRVLPFFRDLDTPRLVEQLGTGVTAIAAHLAPPFSFMDGSQRFVDVRFARWCHQNSIQLHCLPRGEGWLGQLEPGDTIYESFTLSTPRHVQREIRSFAYQLGR